MQGRSCRFRLLGRTSALPPFLGRSSWGQLSRASINNAGHGRSSYEPASSHLLRGCLAPKKLLQSWKECSVRGLAQADHRHPEPSGPFQVSQPQFLHLQNGVDNCASLCKGACVEGAQTFTDIHRRTLQVLHRDTKAGRAQVTRARSGVGMWA